jgi:hypothetical protein
MAALETSEMGLINSIGLLAMAAHGTGTAGVARVHRNDLHACLRSLVGDKAPKLAKGPGMARTALRPSNRDSLADLRQFFESECLTGRACLRNQLLADAVIHISLKARLTAGVLPKAPAGTAGVGLLQLLTLLETALPDRLYLCAAIGLAVAIDGQVVGWQDGVTAAPPPKNRT